MASARGQSMLTKTLDSKADFKEYFIAPDIKKMLLRAKDQVINNDWDRVYIIDGGEGSGKSLLALQLGYFLDPTLNLDRVTFNAVDFGKAIDTAHKGQVIIFDEAFNGLSSSGAMSNMNRFLVRKLMECRQKNLIILIVLPTLFLLQKYVAVFRSRGLFHVFVNKRGERGFYRYYDLANKKTLYLSGNKYYSYKTPFIKKAYMFRGKYPLGNEFEEAYRKKKHESLIVEGEKEKKEKKSRYAYRFALLAKLLKEQYGLAYSKQILYLKKHNMTMDHSEVPHLLAEISVKP